MGKNPVKTFLHWIWVTYETLTLLQWISTIFVGGAGMSIMPIIGAINEWPIWQQVILSALVALLWLTIITWIIDRFRRRYNEQPVISQVISRSPSAQQIGDTTGNVTQVQGDNIINIHFHINDDLISKPLEKRGPNMNREDKQPYIHVESHGQRGGITAYQVNIQPGDRQLTPNVGEQLKSYLNNVKYNSIEIIAIMGDGEAFRFAAQVKNYLIGEGFNVRGVNQAVYTAPIQGQIIEPPNDSGVVKIIIGNR